MEKKYEKLIGQTLTIRGNVFGRVKMPPTKFKVLNVRPSLSKIMNLITHKEHKAYELLLKNSGMKRSRWSLPFKLS